jgi:hypothetical protein
VRLNTVRLLNRKSGGQGQDVSDWRKKTGDALSGIGLKGDRNNNNNNNNNNNTFHSPVQKEKKAAIHHHTLYVNVCVCVCVSLLSIFKPSDIPIKPAANIKPL